MYRVLITILLILMGALAGRAQTLTLEQKSKILELLPPPQLNLPFRVGVNRDGFYLSTEEQDKTVRVVRLLLKKAPTDPRGEAAHRLELAKAYYAVNDKEKGIAQATASELIYRTLLAEKEVPDRLALELKRADALDYGDKTEQAGELLHETVRKYPNAWQAWREYALFAEEGAYRVAAHSAAPNETDFAQILTRLTKHKLSPDEIKKVKDCFAIVDMSLKKARELAPKEPLVIEALMSHRITRVITKEVVANTEGKPIDWSANLMGAMLNNENIALAEEVVERLPNAPLPLIYLTFCQTAVALQQSASGGKAERIPAADRARLDAAVTRLTKIGSDASLSAEERGRAWEGAAVFAMALQEDKAAAERYFRESRLIAPDRSGGWHGGVAALIELKRYDDAFVLAGEYKRRKTTPEVRLLYAATALRAGRIRESEAEFRAIQDEKPDMVAAYLGVATILAKRSATEPDLLNDAVTVLNKIGEKFAQNFGDNQLGIYTITGVLYAVAGQVKNGIEYLEAVDKAVPGNEVVMEMLKILRAAQ